MHGVVRNWTIREWNEALVPDNPDNPDDSDKPDK
jgi:hypothetical protein